MFSKRLNELMNEKKVSQRELANAINITESAMSRYISGERQPRMDIVVKIARFFEISIEELIDDIVESEENSSYYEIQKLVARNASNLNNQQISELITLLSKNIKNETKK